MKISLFNDHTGRDGKIPQACVFCGGELVTQYAEVRDTITNECFSICTCARCGIGHTVPQPVNLAPYYDKAYYGNRHGFTEHFCVSRRLKIVFSIMEELDGRRLLDVGCGDGSFLLALRDSGWDVAGTEMNPEPPSMKGLVVKAHIEEFFNCEPFDCITMWHTLEHMQDIGTTLTLIYKLLKPGGKLIVAVPNNGSLQAAVFKRNWLHLDVPRHLYHFNVMSLQNLLESNRFFIQRQGYQELEYDLLGWTQSTLNSIFTTPNIFFDSLRGKSHGYGRVKGTLNVMIGFLLAAASLPAVAVERIMNRSGTIITIACRDVEHPARSR